MNTKLTIHVIEELLKTGVREFIVCPGSRNASFVNLLSQTNLKCYYWPEERSAAFFALGRAKRLQQPVAMICTSGTAAGEFLPAIMEAYYSSVPLIAVTADRPRRFRGSGAPQSAEQVGLYGVYTPIAFDLEGEELCSLHLWDRTVPVHLNICLEEPKKEEKPYAFHVMPEALPRRVPIAKSDLLVHFLKRVKYPLVVVSGLHPKDKQSVCDFLCRLNAPLYIEGPSGLREEERLSKLRVIEPLLQHHDGVLRIGNVPTHRLWRDLEGMKNLKEVLSISDKPFSGLSWAPLLHTEIAPFFDHFEPPRSFQGISGVLLDYQSQFNEELSRLFAEEPRAEAALIRELSRQIPIGSHIYLGNSLPIREWDLAATEANRQLEITASRGVNGIDGQLSCFLGLSEKQRLNMALLGDLTALYDFAALWGIKDLQDLHLAIVIINNKGGKIFAPMYANPLIQNPHALSFEHFAKFWKIDYKAWQAIPATCDWKGIQCIELMPDAESSKRFSDKLAAIKRQCQEPLLAIQ